MSHRPTYVETFHLQKNRHVTKNKSVYLWPFEPLKNVFVLNKHQIKMVKGLLISKTIFFTSDALQFWCKNIFSDRPKKVKKILGSRFFHFRQNIIFWNNLFFENYSSQNRGRVPRMWREILGPKLVVSLSGRSANQMVRRSPILTAIDIWPDDLHA